MLLTTIFNTATAKTKFKKEEELVFGDVLYREESTARGFDPRYDLVRTYHDSSILKYTGISLDNFLELPIPVRDIYIERARLYAREEVSAMSAVNKTINASLNIGGK